MMTHTTTVLLRYGVLLFSTFGAASAFVVVPPSLIEARSTLRTTTTTTSLAMNMFGDWFKMPSYQQEPAEKKEEESKAEAAKEEDTPPKKEEEKSPVQAAVAKVAEKRANDVDRSTTAVRHHGTVDWFNAQKGYGFIKVDGDNTGGDDGSFFVHQTAIDKPGFRKLAPNERVSFEVQIADDGRHRAVNVRSE